MDLDHAACYRALATRDARFDGRLFVAVKTTGIYCRPICPARTPKPQNVVFFASAAGAQAAGFRPCLRCRPETAPDLAAWRGTSNTVSRALGLIEAGALDGSDVEALADRLGVGERQLRRLFRQHLGASPMAVAQTRRVLLAKQLIHQTRLPMTQVALASGFGSVRRFNETFQQLYDRPPASLRRTQGEAQPLDAGGWLAITLPYRAPYDWAGLIGFLSMRAIAGVESVSAAGYARTIALGDEMGVLKVSALAGDRLAVAIRFARLGALPTIIAKVRRVFDLAADPQAIGECLSQDPVLAPLVAARPGLRVPGAWDGFELAVRAILGQQITVGAATALAGRLVRDFGEPLPETLPGAVPGLTHVFPSARRLADADLSSLGMPRARIAALSSLAAAVAADPTIFGPRRGLDEAIAKLKSLPGIGEWTAQYIAMRELREPDAFPAADVGLMRALAGPDGRRPTPRELLARAEPWRPWRAYAALHLWAADSHPSSLDAEIPDDRQAA
jgi:AraC family transcriptional regulator, regulatory protein of adaptative response / DNA-3-methyladenine glycosylase II